MATEIITKQCPRCKETKSLSRFYKSHNRRNGCQVYCINCTKEHWQTKEYKTIQKRYHQSKKAKVANKKYQQSEKGKAMLKRKNKLSYIKNPEKWKANRSISHAVRDNKLPHPNTLQCHYCPKQAEEYHHPDYSKPLYVLPTCKKCHRIIHTNVLFCPFSE
jgi:hypothetical protein